MLSWEKKNLNQLLMKSPLIILLHYLWHPNPMINQILLETHTVAIVRLVLLNKDLENMGFN